eukprot:5369552-Lingulodinium_polyedra.AAC.1
MNVAAELHACSCTSSLAARGRCASAYLHVVLLAAVVVGGLGFPPIPCAVLPGGWRQWRLRRRSRQP